MLIIRIKEFAESQNLTISGIEKQIGASMGVIRRAVKNGTDIQSKWIEAIADNYPNLSLEWLVTGKGEMLNSNNKKRPQPSNDSSQIEIPNINDIDFSSEAESRIAYQRILIQLKQAVRDYEQLKESQQHIIDNRDEMIEDYKKLLEDVKRMV